MANESIVTGKKYRILVDAAQKLWQRVSFWTKSTDVEFNDGKTAEVKVGSINGITSSLTSSDGSIALSAAAGRTLNSNLTTANTNMSKIKVYVGSDGKLHFVNSGGADTVLPFSRMASGQEAVGTPGRTITINCGFRPNRVFTYNTTRYTTYLYDVRMSVVMHGYANGNWRPMSSYDDVYFAINDSGFSFKASYAYASDTILWFAAE